MIEGFEWDDVNINHLGERGVSDREVEQVLSERHVVMPNRRHPGRMLLIGETHGGRTLVVSIRADALGGDLAPDHRARCRTRRAKAVSKGDLADERREKDRNRRR